MNDGAKIPYIIFDTVEYLKRYGLGKEGVFRKNGNVEHLKILKKIYNEGKAFLFSAISVLIDALNFGIFKGKHVAFTSDEIHNVACLLKLFLRELEEPLLTYELYDEIISLQSKYSSEPCEPIYQPVLLEYFALSFLECNLNKICPILVILINTIICKSIAVSLVDPFMLLNNSNFLFTNFPC
jgi:hypothetical protein